MTVKPADGELAAKKLPFLGGERREKGAWCWCGLCFREKKVAIITQ
jgi:hypothetical protein